MYLSTEAEFQAVHSAIDPSTMILSRPCKISVNAC